MILNHTSNIFNILNGTIFRYIYPVMNYQKNSEETESKWKMIWKLYSTLEN